ncbi:MULTISPECIES: TlyA family RNA methyltransferase [unclassified Methylobacterium]|jgi:23S rRNA (cytidine1920-2'-O)/16S rRNA (cytidine1409-2'-O)-methyltransferase|uniref:TlyA family RNA methyltransferase n=1 Tax=unclassified Methylobacterium TaxID=2615210 RepID=UPI001352F504|nr:TlyA family RNA methyltransferase [Methylobacterium sp. 2A]MWV21871.1 TlyA family RNA methyltransferase [Methylobacterium sp. 2A]
MTSDRTIPDHAAAARRADLFLVEHGHFESRARAQAAIRAGKVRVDGRPLARASETIEPGARIEAAPEHPYASRGGLKLEAALDAFGLDPAGRVALDVGASTGGFTDVLLARGARHVHAVDVGRGQLHPRLAADPRVTNREGTDIRSLDPAQLTPRPDLASVDVSFIGLRLVLPVLPALLTPGANLVALIKPQFEAGRDRIGRGGLVRDPAVHAEVCAAARGELERLGATILGLIASPVTGGDGNAEFLVGARFS